MSAGARERLEHCRSLIRDVPDFPSRGIVFKDITPLLADPRAFHIVLDSLAERYIGEHIDAVVGIEARGFIFGGALAARLNASFVPARKPGKLPAATDRVSYRTEYSVADPAEMHKDSLVEGSRASSSSMTCWRRGDGEGGGGSACGSRTPTSWGSRSCSSCRSSGGGSASSR